MLNRAAAAEGRLRPGRRPLVARWPGRIAPGTTSDLIGYFPDLMLTFMDLIGAYDILPAGIDGLSVAPTLLGKPAEQKRHEFLVWSFPAYTGQQAVRLGSWKAVRRNLQQGKSPLELYDMATDVPENKNVAAEHPDIVKRIEEILARECVPSKTVPIKGVDGR